MMPRWIAVAGAALMLAGCNTSYNYFEDEEDPAVQSQPGAMGFLLGMAGQKRGPGIDYKARAPLVMPPSEDLPDPSSSIATKSSDSGMDWPDDPDERERRRLIAKRAKGEATVSPQEWTTDTGSRRLSPEEIQAGRLAGGGLKTEKSAKPKRLSDTEQFRMSPVELAKTFIPGSKDKALFDEAGNVKPREYLIEPPEEYRTPAATAALPDPDDIEHSSWFEEHLYKKKDRRAEQYKR